MSLFYWKGKSVKHLSNEELLAAFQRTEKELHDINPRINTEPGGLNYVSSTKLKQMSQLMAAQYHIKTEMERRETIQIAEHDKRYSLGLHPLMDDIPLSLCYDNIELARFRCTELVQRFGHDGARAFIHDRIKELVGNTPKNTPLTPSTDKE